jgi:PKD repeat protein
VKSLRLILLGLCCLIAFPAVAQLNIGTVDPGPYTPGSTIAATFTIDPATCINRTSTFQLYLSDATGNFAGETQIGSYNSFYSTFVNGIIPAGTPLGVGYRLRIKSTNPSLVSTASAPFAIVTGSAVAANITSIVPNSAYPDVFGVCTTRDNSNFAFTNASTAGGVATSTFKNELTGATAATIVFNTPSKSFVANLAHYTIFTRVVSNGTVATKANFLVNNEVKNAFGTGNNDVKCLPADPLFYTVDVTKTTGIGNNFPGNIYKLSWGDGDESLYTICDITASGNQVQHMYTESSCGKSVVLNGVPEYNVFAVNISIENPFCGRIGAAISTTAKVATKPDNRFLAPTTACTGSEVTFTNVSLLGENPLTNTSGCEPNKIRYNWYVDGVLEQANKLINYNFVHIFATNGKHTITLESISEGACNGAPITKEICTQNAPQPIFTLGNQNTFCKPTIIKATNASVIDAICDPTVSYRWVVTPSVTFANGTTETSTEPEFNFQDAGIYTISLQITTGSCGTVSSSPQTIIINTTPTAVLSADVSLCNLGTYDFNPTTVGPTKTTLQGTFRDEPTTYTWTVTGGAYEFVNSNLHTKYPQIKFLDYATYTVKVVHENSCSRAEDTQILSFTTAPVVEAGTYAAACFDAPTIQLNGAVTGSTGSVIGVTWIGGGGTFTPNATTLNATYTPTPAERTAGLVNLQLKVTSSLPSPCNEISDYTTIVIKPQVTINSASAKTICTGTAVNYTPESTTAGATFGWTATGSANATGFSATGNGQITDVLTNTSATTDATVTYTITPTGDGCTGVPFTFTVTIAPNPILTTNGDKTICSQQTSSIAIASNLPNTLYTWTSVATGVATGNTSNPTPVATTTIDEPLFNNGTTIATVTYTITPISENGCAGTPVVVTITVEPQPTSPIAGADESICNSPTFVLKGNQPTVGTGKWTQITTFTGVTFSNDAQFNATVSGLQPNNTYIFRWTITGAAPCDPKFDEVAITVNPTSIGGTTTGTQTVCAGANNGQITLAGQVGNIVRWESSTDAGATWAPIAAITNTINYSGLNSTTHYRAIVQSGSCTEAPSTVTIITVTPGSVVAQAGVDQELCNVTSATITANDPETSTGLWKLTSTQTGVTIVNPNSPTTLVNGLIAGQTYQFTWTINGQNPCPPTSDDLIIANLLPIANNTISTPITTICAGQTITFTGTTPTGGNGGYTYAWESSTTGTAPWTLVPNETQKDLTVTINAAISYRRTIISGACPATSNSITMNVLPPIANNTISPASQTICTNTAPLPFTGSVPTGGDGTNYTYIWEQSTDELNWTAIAGATSQNYAPGILVATTFYRRVVSTITCIGPQNSTSNVGKITVRPNAKAEFNAGSTVSCAPFDLTKANIKVVEYPDRNGTYIWYANGVEIGRGVDFPAYTITTANTDVKIKLVVTSSLGCTQDETPEITYSTRSEVKAAFTPSTTVGCEATTITFTNTSSVIAGATFEWFVDGVSVPGGINLGRTFNPDPTGIDKVYSVVLKVTSECGTNTTLPTLITIRTKPPIPGLGPDKTFGCSALTVGFSNQSAAKSSNTYRINFGDGTIQTYNFTDPITHQFVNNGSEAVDYTVTIVASNACGDTPGTPIVIRVLPAQIVTKFFLQGNQSSTVCVGQEITFTNNTSGATSYFYDFKDGTSYQVNTSGFDMQKHTFSTPGTYIVALQATNECPSQANATLTIIVNPIPTVDFTADVVSGCSGFVAKFTNKSTDANSFLWEFGDGKTSNERAPTHIYDGDPGLYTVKLTANNNFSCANTKIATNYIRIVTPPSAAFAVAPGNVIGIPNYTFKFTDLAPATTGKSYQWDFGDQTNSTAKDPSHTYNDVGTFTVTLTTTNEFGCSNTSTQVVQITGVPGYLFVPNSFIPGGTEVPLQKFTAVGSGIATWRMSVFNKWGQVIWETTQLEDGKPLEGWDGTYKGVQQPQGIYFWKIEVQFINGTEWKGMSYDKSPPKRTGQIYLMR